MMLIATFCNKPILYSELSLDHAQPSELEDHPMSPGNDHVNYTCTVKISQ